MKNVAEGMSKDWRVRYSGILHINRDIDSLLLDLDLEIEFDTEDQAMAYYYNFYNKDSYSAEIVHESILRALAKK